MTVYQKEVECSEFILMTVRYIQGSIGIPCRLDVTAKLGVDAGPLDHSEQNWRRVEFVSRRNTIL